MFRDERKWEMFQKGMNWILLGCAFGFLIVVGGMKFSADDSWMHSAFFLFGMVLFCITMVLLLTITVTLIILDVREFGLGQALFRAGKAFFVYLGAAVLLTLMMCLLKGKMPSPGIVREIFLFAVAMDIGAYLGRFSKRRLPGA